MFGGTEGGRTGDAYREGAGDEAREDEGDPGATMKLRGVCERSLMRSSGRP
jgi:hypothetical protein